MILIDFPTHSPLTKQNSAGRRRSFSSQLAVDDDRDGARLVTVADDDGL